MFRFGCSTSCLCVYCISRLEVRDDICHPLRIQRYTIFFSPVDKTWYWSRVAAKFGLAHRVSIDRRTKVIDYVPVGNVFLKVEQIDLRSLIRSGGATLLHSDCGVTMHKPVMYREVMPTGMLRLQRMFGCGATDAVPFGVTCVACGGEASGDSADKRLSWFSCPLCMLTAHIGCNTVSALADAGVLATCSIACLEPLALPPSWRLCALCQVFCK